MGDAVDCNCDGCDCDCDCDGCDCDCDCGNGCGGGDIIVCCCFPGSDNAGRTNRTNSGGEPSFCCCCCLSSNERTNFPSRRPDSKSKKHKHKRGRGFCSRLWRCFSKNETPDSPPSSTPPPQGTKTQQVPPINYQQDSRHPMSQVPPGDYQRDDRYPMHKIPPGDNQRDNRYPLPGLPPRNHQRDGGSSSGMPPLEYYGYGPHGGWKYADDLNMPSRDPQQRQGIWPASSVEQDIPPRDFKLEGKWSRPTVRGDYGRSLKS
ncbi:hypothetical protein Ancab_039828 [Ancistrocladus abbreviatus]